MAVIRKKNWPNDFNLIRRGKKHVQARVADFRVKPRDTIVFAEWDPRRKKYTGRKLQRKVREVWKFRLNDYGQKAKINKRGLWLIRF